MRRQVADDERIGFHALYSPRQAPLPEGEQLPGQLSIADVLSAGGQARETGA